MSGKSIIFSTVANAVLDKIRSESASLDAAPSMQNVAAEQVATQVVNSPEIKHLTNTEDHWWQKRSYWSAIISGVLVVATPLLVKVGFDPGPYKDYVVDGLTTLGGLWAGYLAIRAGIASKPLGT